MPIVQVLFDWPYIQQDTNITASYWIHGEINTYIHSHVWYLYWMVVFQKLKLKWTNGNHFRRGTFFQLFFLPPLFLARKTFTPSSFPHPCFSSRMLEISISENSFFFQIKNTSKSIAYYILLIWRSLHSSCLQQDEVRNINNWKYYILAWAYCTKMKWS